MQLSAFTVQPVPFLVSSIKVPRGQATRFGFGGEGAGEGPGPGGEGAGEGPGPGEEGGGGEGAGGEGAGGTGVVVGISELWISATSVKSVAQR